MNALIEILNLRGGQFLRFAWPMLWQSSLLILLVFTVDFALRKRFRATIRYALWMLVLAKLLLPISFSLPTSVSHWAPLPQSMALNEAISPPWLEDAPPPPTILNRVPPRQTQPAPAPPLPIPPAKLTTPGFVLTAWLCAILLLTAFFLLRAKQARRITTRATATDEFADLLNECAHKLNISSSGPRLLDTTTPRAGFQFQNFPILNSLFTIPNAVRLKLSATLTTPAVCGLFHPVILLPKSLAEKLDQPQIRAVLLHELAHIRRRDLWVSHLQTALQIIYFYNPFLWLASAAIRRVREEAVDEMVLVALADDAAVYPETLVSVAKFSLQSPRLAFGFAGILESKSALAARIRLMLHRPWPTSAKLGLPATFALLILGLILLPMGYFGRMPSYEAKTAAEWFSQINLRKDINDRSNAQAIHAFQQMGAKAVPFLRKTLLQTEKVSHGEGRVGIVPGSGDGRPEPRVVAQNAAYVLEQMGPAAAPAIPDLLRALSGKDGTLATYAAAALGAIGPSARAAVPALFTALSAGNIFAGSALAKIDPDNPALVPALIEIVQNPPPSPNSQPDVEAMAALQILGPKAIAAIPILRNELTRTNGPTVPADPRAFAAFALQRIAPKDAVLAAEIYPVLHTPPGPLPDIDQLLADTESALSTNRTTISLGMAIYELGSGVGALRYRGAPVLDSVIQQKILPVFERAWNKCDPADDTMGMSSLFGGLVGLGRSAAALVPRIIAYLETNNSSARVNACGSLSSIAPGDMTTLPVLIHLLGDVVDPVKQNACADLSHFGPEAQAAVPALHQCLKENSFYIRFNASLALWRIAKEPPSVAMLKAVLNADQGNDNFLPLHTLEMLGGIDLRTNEEAKSLVMQLAQSPSPEVQTNALALLAKNGAN